MRVAAVVVNHRNWPEVASTLNSLRDQTQPLDRIVLVDNGSRSLPVEEVRRSLPDVELVLSRRNLGYAGGMNLGITRVRSDVDAYLLVTHECLLPPDVVEGLSRYLVQAPGVGAVAPLLAYRSRPHIIWAAGGGLDRDTWELCRFGWGQRVEAWVAREPMPVTWVDGACWMIRAQAFEEAGRLDEDFFLYYEDAAYSLRLLELGWGVACHPRLVAYQEPSDAPVYLGVRSGLRFVARTAPREQLIRLVKVFLRDIWNRIRRGELRVPLAQAAGLVAFLLRRTGPTPRFLVEPRDRARPLGHDW